MPFPTPSITTTGPGAADAALLLGMTVLPESDVLLATGATVPDGTLLTGDAALPTGVTTVLTALAPAAGGAVLTKEAFDGVLLDGNTALPAAVPATDETLPFDEVGAAA